MCCLWCRWAATDRRPWIKLLFSLACRIEAKLLMWHCSFILWLDVVVVVFSFSFQEWPAPSILGPQGCTDQPLWLLCLSVTIHDPNPRCVEYWTRPDWLTAAPAVCSHWQLYLLHPFNYSVRRDPSQNPVSGCCTVHHHLWSGCLAENHLIWFGREFEPFLSSLVLRTPLLPSYPLTLPSLPVLTALIPPSRLPSLLAPSWLWRKVIALPFPTVPSWPCPSPVTWSPPSVTLVPCRTPPRRHLHQHSWWGWSRRAPTRPLRGRRGSALPLSPSVQTENCRSCLRWKVRVPLGKSSIQLFLWLHLHFPSASITHRAQHLPGVTPNN